jgi:hypothetical protein
LLQLVFGTIIPSEESDHHSSSSTTVFPRLSTCHV